MSSRYLLVALLFAGGCVGGITDGGGDDSTTDDGINPPPPPPGSNARTLFEQNVFPVITAKCKACHGQVGFLSTPFVADSVATAYDTIIGYDSVVGSTITENAPVLTKVTVGPHQGGGVAYTGGEESAIVAWLAAEVAGQNPGDPPPPGTETPGASTTRLVNEWAGCVTLEDITAINFGPRMANKGSNQGNCEQCHSNGAYGFFVNDDNQTVYDVITTNKYYLLAYYAADVISPVVADRKMIPNFSNFDRVCNRRPPHIEHPACQGPDLGPPLTAGNDDGLLAIQELYDLTMARKLMGTPAPCGPPKDL
jgi:hypothetical protein